MKHGHCLLLSVGFIRDPIYNLIGIDTPTIELIFRSSFHEAQT